MAIILYLGFLLGLISHFEKLGHCDLDKKIIYKKYVKTYFKLIINHQVDFNDI